MKKIIILFLCVVIAFSSFTFNAFATEDVTTDESTQTRATGLITMYSLSISKSGSTLSISRKTYCNLEVVRCGFKNLVVERRINSSSDWEEYHDYGNVYVDTAAANLSTSLTVESGYQYRVTTKHYAKQNIILIQTISNESNIIQF